MKECGIFAAYLAARSKPDLALLDTQRAVTDKAKSRLDGDLVQNLENLAKLAKVREEMSRLRIEPPLPRFPAPCSGDDV